MALRLCMDSYRSSFSLGKAFFATLAVDSICLAIISILFSLAVQLFRRRTVALSGGMTPEAFQSFLLSLQPEQLQAYTAQLQSFVVQFLGIILLLPLLFFLLFSLSRALNWHLISGRPLGSFRFRQHWKWNLLNLALLPVAAGIIVVMIVVRVVIGIFTASPAVFNVANGILILLALTVLLFIVFHSYHVFSGSRKVFRSVGAAFSVFKKHPGPAWFAIAAAFLTIAVLQAVQLPFRTFFFLRPQLALYLNLAMVLVWIAWFRQWVAKTAGAR